MYTRIVYTWFVKNITFSADESLIDRARDVARSERKTLNDAFRDWLASYAARRGNLQQFRSLMERLKHIDSGGPYTRDEMNER